MRRLQVRAFRYWSGRPGGWWGAHARWNGGYPETWMGAGRLGLSIGVHGSRYGKRLEVDAFTFPPRTPA